MQHPLNFSQITRNFTLFYFSTLTSFKFKNITLMPLMCLKILYLHFLKSNANSTYKRGGCNGKKIRKYLYNYTKFYEVFL